MFAINSNLVWADGTANTEAHWSERNQKWVFVDFLNGEVEFVKSWVEVTILDGVDPEDGLNQSCIACDLSGRGLWVIDADEFDAIENVYGDAIEVIRTGGSDGEVRDEG